MQRSAAEGIHDATGRALAFTGWLSFLCTYTVVLLSLRCFVALEFQPRLAIVVATLKATSIDLMHFLIIIVPTFGAFAIAGMFIFGRRVNEFASLERSVGTCFVIATTSNFDWEELSAEHFWTAASWVWTYVWLMVLIILNMVLAIIMDVYTEVRGRGANEETVWESLWWLWNRLRHLRRWLPGERLLAAVEVLPRVFTEAELSAVLPDMPPQQLAWLAKRIRQKAQSLRSCGQDHRFYARMLGAMHVGLHMSKEALDQLRAESARSGADGPGSKPDEISHEDIMNGVAAQSRWMEQIQEQLDAMRSERHARVRAAAVSWWDTGSETLNVKPRSAWGRKVASGGGFSAGLP